MLAQPPAQPANPAIAQQAPVLPIAPAQPIFALGPGQDNTMLDYSNTSHIKTYYKAITTLETNYDGKSSSLHIFMNSISNRAKDFRRSNILNIDDSGRTTRNLLNDYGQLTMEEVKNHAQTMDQPTYEGHSKFRNDVLPLVLKTCNTLFDRTFLPWRISKPEKNSHRPFLYHKRVLFAYTLNV